MLRPGSRLKVWSLTSTLLCHDNELFPVFFLWKENQEHHCGTVAKVCLKNDHFALCPPHKLCKKTSVARRSPWQNLARSMQRCFAASLKAVLNAKGVDGGANGSISTIGLSWIMHDDAWRSCYANMLQQLLRQVVWLPTFVLQWLQWALQGLDARMLEELALRSNLAEYQQIPFWTCRFMLDGSGKKGWHGQDNKEQYKPTKNRLPRQNQQHVYTQTLHNLYQFEHLSYRTDTETGNNDWLDPPFSTNALLTLRRDGWFIDNRGRGSVIVTQLQVSGPSEQMSVYSYQRKIATRLWCKWFAFNLWPSHI